MKPAIVFVLAISAGFALQGEPASTALAPTTDRVGFPKEYAETFTILRTVSKPAEHKLVTGTATLSQHPSPIGLNSPTLTDRFW